MYVCLLTVISITKAYSKYKRLLYTINNRKMKKVNEYSKIKQN